MSDNSAIEWTDTTWNPVVGCAKVSPGCKRCYAETMAARHVLMSQALGRTSPYLPVVDIIERRDDEGKLEGFTRRWNGRAVTLPERLAEPLSWRKPRRVFVNSMSDLFHDDVPFEFVAAVFGVMAATRRHTFQVLTKRPARMLEFFAWLTAQIGGPRTHVCWEILATERGGSGPFHEKHGADPDGPWPLPNVWLGVSAENQATADERIPLLLQAPAAVRFVSAEPLLGAIDLRRIGPMREGDNNGETIDWIIAGGESGPGARPCDVAWIRSIVEQCAAARVSCFVKQLGAWPVGQEYRPGLRRRPAEEPGYLKLSDRKGGDPLEWPEDLRVRQFPEVTRAG